MIDEAINNFSRALKNHLELQKEESVVKVKLQKSRQEVLRTSEEMRMVRQEILADHFREL